MKQYYLIIENEQVGPLTFEEVLTAKISKETKIWFDGIEEWTTISEIEEFSVLKVPPPIINKLKTPPPLKVLEKEKEIAQDLLSKENAEKSKQNIIKENLSTENKEDSKILGINKSVFIGVCIFLIFIIIFYNYQQNTKEHLTEINSLTEQNNLQIDNQQIEIDEQKAKLLEQEQIENNRKIQEEKNQLEIRYRELSDEVNQLYSNLSDAENNLKKTSEFALFRTTSERNDQIESIQGEIDLINNQISVYEDEMNKINKQLEAY